jgi:hypothetical protein
VASAPPTALAAVLVWVFLRPRMARRRAEA